MISAAQVTIHPSQFPDQVRADLLESLRKRQLNHKFHYDSIKQTQKWLELHQAYSPSRTDRDCEMTYLRAFRAVCARPEKVTNLIGLGCGGGVKDSQLLKLLWRGGSKASYVPCDVSVAMVLVARETAQRILPYLQCHPLVCDLARADDLPKTLAKLRIPGKKRLVTFFGMLPNFEPELVLPHLARLLGRRDKLLLSANLAPGRDYDAGVRKILPMYDNGLTREWLMMFLTDLGIKKADGELVFGVENVPLVLTERAVRPHPGPLPRGEGERSKCAASPGGEGWGEGERNGRTELNRVVVHFRFNRSRLISVGAEKFRFRAGERVRLFFSYRHTPELVRKLANAVGLRVLDQWLSRSGEEGVFLVERG